MKGSHEISYVKYAKANIDWFAVECAKIGLSDEVYINIDSADGLNYK